MQRRLVFSREDIARIVARLEATLAEGKPIEAACEESGISEATFYRWRQQHSRWAQPSSEMLLAASSHPIGALAKE